MPRLPTDKEIVALYRKYRTPAHIQQHQQVVATVTTMLAERLRASSMDVKVSLARAGAFLHDIGKIYQIQPDLKPELESELQVKLPAHHSGIGEAILVHEGFPDVGRLVLLHIGSAYARDPSAFKTIEEKLVMLGDMRVLEDGICDISQRVEYITRRYGPVFKNGYELLVRLEYEVYSIFGGKPSDLATLIGERGLEVLRD